MNQRSRGIDGPSQPATKNYKAIITLYLHFPQVGFHTTFVVEGFNCLKISPAGEKRMFGKINPKHRQPIGRNAQIPADAIAYIALYLLPSDEAIVCGDGL
jgi:hypothetical protein